MEQAPDFCLPTIQGPKPEMKLADFRGKILLLSFWVTWCPDCQRELPQLEVFYRGLNNEGVTLLTVNVTGRQHDLSKVTPFLKKGGYTFPVLRDNGTETYDAYGATSVPTTVIVDQEGMIQGRYGDNVPFSEVVVHLGKLL